MKKIISYVLILFSIFVTITLKNKNVKNTNAVNLSNTSSEIVMEIDSKRILTAKNENKRAFMASLTKIITAIVIIENCNLDDKVTVTKETVGIEGSSIYLEEGEVLTVKELLYGLMLRSGNDCAETLAVYCSKSINKFADLMNDFAKKVGAVNSHFVNPHGLHNDEHYTTAYDLALICSYAMQNDTFREIVSAKKAVISHSNRDYDRILINKNKMLNLYDGATGIKTGYTKKAGRCLASSVKKDNMELICIVLNCAPMFERSMELFDYCFENYSKYKLIESDNIIDFIDVEDEKEKRAIIVKNDIELPLTKKEYENIFIEYEYPNKINKSQFSNSEIGKIKFYHEKNLLFEEKIYTI